MPSFRVVGPGRAGGSLVVALTASGWESAGLLGRADDPTAAAVGVDLLVLATPDAAIGEVAARVDPVPTTVVAHLSGATGLDVLGPHVRRASVHPLVSLPDVEVGARRLRGAWFAVATEPSAASLVHRLVDDLGGRSFPVAAHLAALPAGERATYRALAAEARRLAGRVQPGGGR